MNNLRHSTGMAGKRRQRIKQWRNTNIICQKIILNDHLAPADIRFKKYIIIRTTHLSDTAGLCNQVHTDTGSR